MTAQFRPITLEDWSPSSGTIVVSCIWKEDNNTCYITSVDLIFLLEALLNTRFTVEEKNRIRRNLEGYKPVTVTKNKPGWSEFFKLIMSFQAPRPRNIEKDVKVFEWNSIQQAICKIIGKYVSLQI